MNFSPKAAAQRVRQESLRHNLMHLKPKSIDQFLGKLHMPKIIKSQKKIIEMFEKPDWQTSLK
jgi:hypothetical protein